MDLSTKQCKRTVTINLNYYIHLPKGYNEASKWPLILFLHGAGERGDSLEDLPRVLQNGLPKYIEENSDFPFIAVMPQCPTNSYWPAQVEQLNTMLDEVINDYCVDEDRVYLTGLSMGGYGTWYLGFSHTERFAALVPVCGSGIRSSAQKLKNTPIWVFHGEDDPIVPFADSEYLVNAIKEAGGNIRFTRYPNVGHDSWTETYANPELYDWMLQQKRK